MQVAVRELKASKIGADQIAQSFYLSFGTPVTVLRPFNTYGPRQSARAVIPTIITQIASGQRRMTAGWRTSSTSTPISTTMNASATPSSTPKRWLP